MLTSSQPQHDFAAERLFWVFGSFHSTTYWLIFYVSLNTFLNEVLRHSDLLDQKLLMASTSKKDAWQQNQVVAGKK